MSSYSRETLVDKGECESKSRQFLSYIPNMEWHRNFIDVFYIYLKQFDIYFSYSLLLLIRWELIYISQFWKKFVKYELINPNIIIFTSACVTKLLHIWRNLLIYISGLHC